MNILENNNKNIEYEIIRKNIKNLYIQIKDGKVIIKSPNRLKTEKIEKFIQEKSEWILKALEKDKNRIKEDNKVPNQLEIENLKEIIEKVVNKYSSKINEYPNKITIKSLKSAWGSCTSNRNIAINNKLAFKEREVIEYVVLHELCHLKYMNHSKKFWSLVEENMNNYKSIRKKLK